MSSRYRWISSTDICLMLWRGKNPDIINIDSMVIQEGIASQLRVLRVDEVFQRQITIKMHRLGCSLST